jgi:amino acid transporter
MFGRIKRLLLGGPRDIRDPRLFHKVSLVALLAWVGLGADGLSSSAYGPDEAFKILQDHRELAVLLAIATALTVLIISYAYSRTIEQFPTGGGYAVATKLLGGPLGVISGSALLVDYVLTVSVSIASAADQVFSSVPASFHGYKVPLEYAALLVLTLMNLRGVKESIKVLLPIFVLFVVCHLILLGGAFITHAQEIPAVAEGVSSTLQQEVAAGGTLALLLLLARAYAYGAGTYTGIEAVSNAVQIMREPKVATAQRTMWYMAISLAVTAGGLLLAYMLLGVERRDDMTMNAVLLENLGFGRPFMVLTLVSEAALLVVAAQTGFIGGPRVMANMALDSWVPHRFSSLSERLTLQDGVLLMGAAGAATLLYTGGDIGVLVTMYAINVFITFTLTQLGMCLHWVRERRTQKRWKRSMVIHIVGTILSAGILVIVIYEKFSEGAWVTLVVTGAVVLLCFAIRHYYRRAKGMGDVLSRQVEALPADPSVTPATGEPEPGRPTAALLVSGFGGLGVHCLMTILKLFPGHFKQVVFVSVGVMDSGNFKGIKEVDQLQKQTQENLDRYVALARKWGLNATSMMKMGTDPVDEAEELCRQVAQRYPGVTFFAGKLVFQREKWYHRLLHNETATALQRRLHWQGLPLLILPVRVFN